MAEKAVSILSANAVCMRPEGALAAEDTPSLAAEIMAAVGPVPDGTALYLATTVGSVELLERGECDDTVGNLLETVGRAADFSRSILVSAACAGGQQAVAAAVRAIRAGRCRNALVVAIDGKSEFVSSGFASLGAVSGSRMRPYDANRDGLVLGGGAGALLLGCGGEGSAQIAGIGSSCDAAHITAPDLGGGYLAEAIRAALADAGIGPGGVGGIIGHGTGTVHNDAAEIAALNAVFGEGEAPALVSVKAFTGHTLAATGVIQLVYALEYLRSGRMPGQYALENPMPGAERFVSGEEREIRVPAVLSLNAGFGGINSAVIVKGGR